MNTLIVGGSFNDDGGKASNYILKFSEEYKKYCRVKLFNGGAFEDLKNILNMDENYDAILWFANIPNEKHKIVQNIKQQFPKTILAISKRNLDKTYKSQDLIERALKNKANMVLEFTSINDEFGVSIHDPLGNCFLLEENNISKVAYETFRQINRLSLYTRITSTCIGNAIDIPEEDSFFNIIKYYAETFHSLINANTTRFLGNASFRCRS